MNNEIKEILEYLKDKNDYIEDFGISYKRIHIDNGDLKILLNYIIKLQEDVRTGQEINSELQQENERLKKHNRWLEDKIETYFDNVNMQNDLLIEQLDYKSCCEKAIEYVNKHFEDGEGIICKDTGEHTCEVNYNFLEDLLDILQNGGEKDV